MIRKLTLALLVALSTLALYAPRAASATSTKQPCATMSATKYCVAQVGNQSASPFGPDSAWLNALNLLMDQLVEESGVVCGPCAIPDACQAKPYLDNSIKTLGPWKSGNQWLCRVWYEGCYRIECSACDA